MYCKAKSCVGTFLLAWILLPLAHAESKILTLVTEEYPPFNMQVPGTQEISGISTEKLKVLMQRAGEKYTMKLYPWSRSFKMAQTDARTCVFSTTRTPEREALFKWVGPLVKNNWVIFGRADEERHPKSLDDIRTYVLGAYRKGAVSEYLFAHGYQVDLANYDADNPHKLLYGRFDFWATGELLGRTILVQQGLVGKIVPLFQFNHVELYLACQLGFPQEKIDLFNQILKEMDRDGSTASIEKKYY